MSLLSALSLSSWLPIGPAPIDAPGVGLGFAAGRVEGAAAHPSLVDVLYLGANGGGIWKTTNWTNDPPSWTALTDDQQSLNFAGFHPLVVHPAAGNTVLGAVCGHGAGVLRSTNGGVSWQLLGSSVFDGGTVGSIAVDPASTNVMYVAVWNGIAGGGGVYKSTDGGLNWSNTTAFHGGGASDVIVARWNAQTLFACLIGPTVTCGVYKSSDGGANWTLLGGLPSGATLGGAARLESGAASGVVYASCLTIPSPGAAAVVTRARTANGGTSWTALGPTPGSVETRSWHMVLGVDPASDKHVFCNDAYKLFESKDSGASWTSAESIGDDWVNIGFDSKGQAVVTADRNVYRYNAKNKAWKSKQGNLQITELYDITPDPGFPDVVYSVSQDHPRAIQFTGTNDWAYIPGGGETGKVLVDPKDTSRVYVSNPLDPTVFVARSEDMGQTWKTIFNTTDFVAQDYGLAYTVQRSFAIDPKTPARLLIGTTRVWETTNAKAATPTWTDVSGVLSGSTASQQHISALAIAPSAPNTVYAATGNGHVFATTDGGAHWAPRDAGLFGMGAGRIVDIRVDPTNASHAYAVGTSLGSIWRLDESSGSLAWSRIAGDLPPYLSASSVVSDAAVFPVAASHSIYVGTTRGVYRSNDGGVHWTPFGADMPNVNVTDLEIGVSGAFYAGTYGRGVWAIALKLSLLAGRVGSYKFGPAHVSPGDPVEGVTIFLQTESGLRVPGLEAVTDARGQYRIENVPPGRYRVGHRAPAGYIAAGPMRDRITVNGSEVRDLDFVLGLDVVRAEAARPYGDTASLTKLPGREPGQAVGAKGEFTPPRSGTGRPPRAAAPSRNKKNPPRRK